MTQPSSWSHYAAPRHAMRRLLISCHGAGEQSGPARGQRACALDVDPLGDCPAEQGGLTYLEGSHHWALAEERARGDRRPAAFTADLPALADARDARWLMADYRAGDVMVHSSYIVHASTDNVDPQGRIRLSTDIRYQRASEPIDWRWQEHWHEDNGL
ncbi:phytanoyl-CoA dioxygenase family protein [Microbacterium maritypicum]